MTTRNRMTWQRNKKASPPPASYGWTPDHPAFYPDPEANKYENGDTSSWAEDPTKGPYAQGPAPASQSWVPTHPAAKADAMGPIPPPVGPDAGKKAAALRARVEVKAAKCIRVASAILGKGASTQAIENKALALMDMSDRKIDAALVKVRQAFLTGEGPMGEDMDGDGIDQNDPETYDYTGMMDVEVPIMAGGKGGKGKHADKYAELEAKLAAKLGDAKAAAIAAILAGDEPEVADDEPVAEGEDPVAEAMLAEMLTEGDDAVAEEVDAEDAMAEAMLAEMLAGGKGGKGGKSADEVEADETLAMIAELMAGHKAEEAAPTAGGKGGKGKHGDDMVAKLADEIASLKAELEGLKAGKHSEEAPVEADLMGLGDEVEADDAIMAALFGKAASGKGGKGHKADDEGEEAPAEGEAKKEARRLAKLFAKLAKKAEGEEEVEADDDEPVADKKSDKKAVLLKQLAKLAAKLADDDEGEGEVEADDDAEEAPKAGAKGGKGKSAYQSLFAANNADDDDGEADDDEVEVEVEAEDDSEEESAEAKKEARLRPQARKASVGVKSLGAVRTASAASGSDLSKLWKSAPDVSDHF